VEEEFVESMEGCGESVGSDFFSFRRSIDEVEGDVTRLFIGDVIADDVREAEGVEEEDLTISLGSEDWSLPLISTASSSGEDTGFFGRTTGLAIFGARTLALARFFTIFETDTVLWLSVVLGFVICLLVRDDGSVSLSVSYRELVFELR